MKKKIQEISPAVAEREGITDPKIITALSSGNPTGLNQYEMAVYILIRWLAENEDELSDEENILTGKLRSDEETLTDYSSDDSYRFYQYRNYLLDHYEDGLVVGSSSLMSPEQYFQSEGWSEVTYTGGSYHNTFLDYNYGYISLLQSQVSLAFISENIIKFNIHQIQLNDLLYNAAQDWIYFEDGDENGDGICSLGELCWGGPAGDDDGDGVCEIGEYCNGIDDDGDGVCEMDETCWGNGPAGDDDGDGVCEISEACCAGDPERCNLNNGCGYGAGQTLCDGDPFVYTKPYFYCFTGDTLISTSKGKVKIKDLKKEDKVISFNLNSSKLVESNIDKIIVHPRGVNWYYLVKTINSQVEVTGIKKNPKNI